MSHWEDSRKGANRIWCEACRELCPSSHVKLEQIVRPDGSAAWSYVCREAGDGKP